MAATDINAFRQSNDSEHSPTSEKTLRDAANTPDTEDTIAAAKQEAAMSAASQSSQPKPHLRDSPPSNQATGSLKDRLVNSLPAKHITTALYGDHSSLGDDEKRDYPGRSRARPWRMSFLRLGPLSGVFCMFLALASIIASLGILAGSDGQPVANWSVPPSTYLAIFTALANLSVRYAALQGVVIAWWFRAAKGTTLAKLHWDWRSGTTLRGALTAGRHTGLLALACIFSTVVVIDGPLLQRASSVVPARIVDHPVPLNISMAPEIPRDYTGYWATSRQTGLGVQQIVGFNATIPGPSHPVSNYIFATGRDNFAHAVIAPWLEGYALTNVVKGCQKTCKARIQAPALFATKCTTDVLSVDYRNQVNVQAVLRYVAPPLENNAFTLAVVLDVSGEQEKLNMFTGFATLDEDCKGTYNYTTCTLESGIGEYGVTVEGEKATLDTPVVPRIIALARNAAVNHTFLRDETQFGQPSTLAKVAEESIYQWNMAIVYYGMGNSPGAGTMTFGSGPYYEAFQLPSKSACKSWRDPREEALESLNKLMVYIGAAAATEDEAYLSSHMDDGLAAHTSITGYLDGDHNVFKTSYWYFVGAAIVEVVCIILVAPTYWGWWKIGRPVSFSPLEMAKAFESPMLADCNSNSSGRDLANKVGEVEVKYGAVRTAEMGEQIRIRFDQPARVDDPKNGMQFDV